MLTTGNDEIPPCPKLGLCVRYSNAGIEHEMMVTSIQRRPVPRGHNAETMRQNAWFNVIGIGIVTAVFEQDGPNGTTKYLWEGYFNTHGKA